MTSHASLDQTHQLGSSTDVSPRRLEVEEANRGIISYSGLEPNSTD